MANLKLANPLRDSMMDEIATLAGASATIKIFSGTQPASGGAETTLLATLTCDAGAFAGSSSGGVLTLNPVIGATAIATGTSNWFRIESSGSAYVMDGDISVIGGGGDMQLDSISIVLNGSVALGGPNQLVGPNP